MQLKYRGTDYNADHSPLEVSDVQIGGKYRGLDWRFRNWNNQPVVQPPRALTYRGVKYANGPAVATQQSGATASIAEKARVLALKQEQSAMKRQQSMLGRLADELGLKSSAHRA